MNSSVKMSGLSVIEDSADSEDKGVLCSVSGDKDDDAESCNCDKGQAEEEEEEDEEVGRLEDEGGEVIVNELEDKVFWETCIAVGYP